MIRKLFISIMIALTSSDALASVDCTSKVKHIQVVDDGRVLIYLEGQNWSLLAANIEESIAKTWLSLALAAQASQRQITIRYPEGYNCDAWETNTPATMVRTYSS
ncbi:MAG: hypothetical protein MK096_15090 [Oleiphilaceae bacterium]|nr:hypothetical protein [Oleiphilaceae bacterium]